MSVLPDVGQRAEMIKARVALSSIVGQKVALRRSGREYVGLCPFHADSSVGSFSVNDDKALYKCFACGASGDHFKFLIGQGVCADFIAALRMLEADAGIDFGNAKVRADWDREKARRELEAARDAERRRLNARNLWLTSAPGACTPAQAYLEGRGIRFDLLHFPGAIRFRPDAWHSQLKRKLPAMVSAMTGPNGHHASHFTYLERQADGRWTKISDATFDRACPDIRAKDRRRKSVLGNVEGASIPLHRGASGLKLPRAPAGELIAVSEGIENALSVAMARPELRCHAAYSADNLGNVWLPAQLRQVMILCDRDRPGSGGSLALERALEKLQARGLEAWLAPPDEGFKDFNDQLMGKRMEGV